MREQMKLYIAIALEPYIILMSEIDIHIIIDWAYRFCRLHLFKKINSIKVHQRFRNTCQLDECNIPGGPKKRTVDFSGLCSDQQLSLFTLLDRKKFLIIITPRSSNLGENFLFYE